MGTCLAGRQMLHYYCGWTWVEELECRQLVLWGSGDGLGGGDLKSPNFDRCVSNQTVMYIQLDKRE